MREGGRLIRASISINTVEGERRGERGEGRDQGRGGGSSCTAREEEEEEEAGLPLLCMQITTQPHQGLHSTDPAK